ncbi:hypothetical protein ACIQHZ_31585 [Streptomyces halstedii]|uniref:hypothetical protein n=1 Tax=Streptomyces halstedii TaxID=1944 RepID=UPI00380E087F
MKFTLTITGMGNAAFVEGEQGGPEWEVARILRVVADRIESGPLGAGTLRDINGNTVGKYRTTEDDDQ